MNDHKQRLFYKYKRESAKIPDYAKPVIIGISVFLVAKLFIKKGK